MLRHPLLPPGDGVGELLHHVGVVFQIALGGKIGGVGHVAALGAQGAEDIALPRLDHLGGAGLKEGHVVPVAAGEGPGHHVELHRGVHRGVHVGLHAVLPHHVLQCHLRHAAQTSADDGLALHVVPGEGGVGAAHQEGAVPLGQLGEDPGIVLLALVVDVDAALAAGQADVALTGHHGGHHLVGAAAVGQLDVQPLVGKEAQLHGHVLRRVEDGVGHLVEPHRYRFRFAAAPGERRPQQRKHSQQKRQLSFHCITPNK